MNKEETIALHYGEHFDVIRTCVNENGWLDAFKCNTVDEIRVYNFFHDKYVGEIGWNKVRPISLNGIENNRGWIKIENKQDFPKEDFSTKYHICNGILVYKTPVSFKYLERRWIQGIITHYQPVITPNCPLI